MFEVLNQHSFIAVAAVTVAVTALLVRRRRLWIRWPVLLALVAVLAGFFVAMRIGAGDVGDESDLHAALALDRPVVVQFYSDY